MFDDTRGLFFTTLPCIWHSHHCRSWTATSSTRPGPQVKAVSTRGRCIGVLLSLSHGLSFVFVLVCLSIDVTGALVLPNSFCFARFFLLLAPPFFCPLVISPYSGPAQFASLLLCLCCPPSPCLFCASLLVLPGGARVFVFVFCAADSLSLLVLCSSLCLCGPRCFPCCLPSLAVLPASVLLASKGYDDVSLLVGCKGCYFSFQKGGDIQKSG